MPPRHLADSLSRREKQIIDILFRRGEATVTEVRAELPDPPSYSAVRAQLRILEEKGHVTPPRRWATLCLHTNRSPR